MGQVLDVAVSALDFKPTETTTGKIRMVATYRGGQDKAYIAAVSRAFKVIDPAIRCTDLLKLINETKCAVSAFYLVILILKLFFS